MIKYVPPTFFGRLFILIGMTLFFVSLDCFADNPSDANSAKTQRFALLVGCTKYPNCPKVHELYGPHNDVPNLSRLLQKKYGFDRSDIHSLVDWPEDTAARPTYSNIVDAFEHLINVAREDSQVVILMSGHGMQVPDDGEEEHDGLDEVFLPADVGMWTGSTLPNSIRDDQFGLWFDALRKNGANVWVIYDCCHSGTMTRAIEESERVRSARPVDLGLPAVPLRKHSLTALTPDRPLDAKKMATGSLTEFYAAQSFEEAPELPRPAEASGTPSSYYGLFTYMLVQTLEQRSDSLSYADLSRAIVNSYRSERGARSPTPFFVGDLDREVLGVHYMARIEHPEVEVYDGKVHVHAGELRGITAGSILAVFGGKPNDAVSKALGFVKAVEVTPTSTMAEPCGFEGHPSVSLSQFPQGAWCKVVSRDLGEMRLNVHLCKSANHAGEVVNQRLDRAIKRIPAEISKLINFESDERNAKWRLVVTEPAEAKAKYGRTLDETSVILVSAHATPFASAGHSTNIAIPYLPGTKTEAVAEERLADQIANDLQKLFIWQNVWRVAGRSSDASESDLELDIVRNNAIATGSENVADSNILHVGDKLSITIANEGIDPWWYSLIHLDPRFGIEVWRSGSIDARSKLKPVKATIMDGSYGPEGVILIATPMLGQKNNPEYDALVQTSIGLRDQLGSSKGAPTTTFGRLMAGAAAGKATRAVELEAVGQPQVILHSWLTLPKPQPK